MKIEALLVPITWLNGIQHGYACGYIGVPPEHPWYGKHYDDISSEAINVHRGLTWAGNEVPNQPECRPERGLWWLGFDTAHGGDNMFNCDQTYCQAELNSLQQQAMAAAL